ncbi:HECT domain-containing protein [Giardia muris]|uniref:HECT-type E3 ubiquitin transferase n=1 Tax=Giardia muris TaxID=5742 RepID=A0A4Z1SN80_GIAMU|nr:HECT domain-containing protein [Giardia muris]|eukprot:TNJ26305.1 HECT domain-containing protein [Giardia muris]
MQEERDTSPEQSQSDSSSDPWEDDWMGTPISAISTPSFPRLPDLDPPLLSIIPYPVEVMVQRCRPCTFGSSVYPDFDCPLSRNAATILPDLTDAPGFYTDGAFLSTAADGFTLVQESFDYFTDASRIRDTLRSLRASNTLLSKDPLTPNEFARFQDFVGSFLDQLNERYAGGDGLTIHQKNVLVLLIKGLNHLLSVNYKQAARMLAFLPRLWPVFCYFLHSQDKAIVDALVSCIAMYRKVYTVLVCKKAEAYRASVEDLKAKAKERAKEQEGVDGEVEREASVEEIKVPPLDPALLGALPTIETLRRFISLSFKSAATQGAAVALLLEVLNAADIIAPYCDTIENYGQAVTDGDMESLQLSIEAVRLATRVGSRCFLEHAQKAATTQFKGLNKSRPDELVLALQEYYLTVIRAVDEDESEEEALHSSTESASGVDVERSQDTLSPEPITTTAIADLFYQRGKGVDGAVIAALNALKARAHDDTRPAAEAGDEDEEDEAAVAAELARLMNEKPTYSDDEENEEQDASSGEEEEKEEEGEESTENREEVEAYDDSLPQSLLSGRDLPDMEQAEASLIRTIAGAPEVIPVVLGPQEPSVHVELTEDAKLEADVVGYSKEGGADFMQMRQRHPRFVASWLRHNFGREGPYPLDSKMDLMCRFITKVSEVIQQSKGSCAAGDEKEVTTLTEDEETEMSVSIERITTDFLAEFNGARVGVTPTSVRDFLEIFVHAMELGFIGEFEAVDFDQFLSITQALSICSEVFMSVNRYVKYMHLLQNATLRESLMGSDKKMLDYVVSRIRALDDSVYLSGEHNLVTKGSRLNGSYLRGTVSDLSRSIERICNMALAEFLGYCFLEEGIVNCVLLELLFRSYKDFIAFLANNPDLHLKIIHLCWVQLLKGYQDVGGVAEKIDVTDMNLLSYLVLLLFILSGMDGDRVGQTFSLVEQVYPELYEQLRTEDPEFKPTVSEFTLDSIVVLVTAYLQAAVRFGEQYSGDRYVGYILAILNQGTTARKLVRFNFDLCKNKGEGRVLLVDGANLSKLLLAIADGRLSGLFEKSHSSIPKLKARSDAGAIARRLLTTGLYDVSKMTTLDKDLYSKLRVMTSRIEEKEIRYVDRVGTRLMLASLFLDRVARNKIPVTSVFLESLLLTLEYVVHKELLDPSRGLAGLFAFPTLVRGKLSTFILSLLSLSTKPITPSLMLVLYTHFLVPVPDLCKLLLVSGRQPNLFYLNADREQIVQILANPQSIQCGSIDLNETTVLAVAPASLVPGAASQEPQEPQDSINVPSEADVSLIAPSASTPAMPGTSVTLLTPLGKLVQQDLIHCACLILLALGNWENPQLFHFLRLPPECPVTNGVSSEEGTVLLRALHSIIGDYDRLQLCAPLVLKTLPYVFLLSGCVAQFDEAVFVGNTALLRDVLRALLPTEVYDGLIRAPVSGFGAGTTSFTLTGHDLSNASGILTRPLSNSLAARTIGCFGSTAGMQSTIIPLDTRRDVISGLKQALQVWVTNTALSAGAYPLYDVYENCIIELSQLEICSIYVIGWLRLSAQNRVYSDTASTGSLVAMLSRLPQLQYSPVYGTDDAEYSFLSFGATVPSRLVSANPSSSHSTPIPGLFSPQFHTASKPLISLLFPAFTLDGAISNHLGRLVTRYLSSEVGKDGFENLLHEARAAEKEVGTTPTPTATEAELTGYLQRRADALRSLFHSYMDRAFLGANLCSILAEASQVLQYDTLPLVGATDIDLLDSSFEKMDGYLDHLSDTLCAGSEQNVIFEATVPLDQASGDVSTVSTVSTAPTPEKPTTGTIRDAMNQVQCYIPIQTVPEPNFFSYLTSASTVEEASNAYETFVCETLTSSTFIQSRAVVDPSCLQPLHLGLFFSYCASLVAIRALLDGLYRKSVLNRCEHDPQDSYFSLFLNLTAAHRRFCIDTSLLSPAWFGVDLRRLLRVIAVDDEDEQDIWERKLLTCLKRVSITACHVDSQLKTQSTQLGSALSAATESAGDLPYNTWLGFTPQHGARKASIALGLGLLQRSPVEYYDFRVAGFIQDLLSYGRAFLISLEHRIFIFRHMLRISNNAYLPEQTLNETMVEATKYVPRQGTTLEIRVMRDAPLISLVEYLKQSTAASQAALQKPWRVTFLNESALDLHGPRQEYMNLVTSDLVRNGASFSPAMYIPRYPPLKNRLARQTAQLEFMLLSYLVSRAVTEFLTLSFVLPISLARRVCGIRYSSYDVLLCSPEIFYGCLVTPLVVGKDRYEDFVGLSVTDIPCDEGLDTEPMVFKCNGDAMECVRGVVELLCDRRGRAIDAVAKMIQKNLPGVDIGVFTPLELQWIISGRGEMSPEKYLSLLHWEHPPDDSASSQVSEAVEKTFKTVVTAGGVDFVSKLLAFMTGSSRSPPGAYEPPLKIQRLRADGETSETTVEDLMEARLRLPSASTCFHSLKLPPYCTEEALRRALDVSVSEGQSFEFA